MDWFVAFALTVAVEATVLAVSLWDYGIRTLVGSAIILNIITHPFVWFILPAIFSGSYYVIIAELFAVLAEYIMLRFMFRRETQLKLLLTSFTMNFTSFYVGGVLHAIYII